MMDSRTPAGHRRGRAQRDLRPDPHRLPLLDRYGPGASASRSPGAGACRSARAAASSCGANRAAARLSSVSLRRVLDRAAPRARTTSRYAQRVRDRVELHRRRVAFHALDRAEQRRRDPVLDERRRLARSSGDSCVTFAAGLAALCSRGESPPASARPSGAARSPLAARAFAHPSGATVDPISLLSDTKSLDFS
jgi:hypothetical protein